jgi:hypothetical protein
MIVLQDRIDVPAAHLQRLRTLFRERYLPGATARGMTLLDERVSPPLRLADQDNTLWLRWSVPDAGAWWQMRYASGDPAVAAFWREVDGFVTRRERHCLVAGDTPLPAPEDVSSLLVQPTGWRETAQLYLRDAIDDSERAGLEALLQRAGAELPGLHSASIAANFVADYGAGHYTWDLLWSDREAAQRAQGSALWRDELLPALDRCCRARTALGLETLGAGARAPELANAVKRTALFRLLPGIDPELRQRYERDLLEMGAQIPEILNWRLSRALPLAWDASDVPAWSYVWEQEYATLDGLTGPYMAHPHHWAHIDRWFDPESGTQIVDVQLCHAFSPLAGSIIVR